MSTTWDFITLAIFAGLILLFLQRSMDNEKTQHDPMWRYLVAAVGCGVTNYFGNEVNDIAAIAALIATVGFILYELRPFPQFPRR
jgi:hypothetical protein